MKKLLAMMVGAAAITASAGTAQVSWFTDPVAGLTDGTITTAGKWTAPTSGEAIKGSNVIALDTELNDQLVYTESASEPVVTIDATIQATVNTTLPAATDFSANQAVLTVVTNTTDSKLEWVGLVKSGDTVAWQHFAEATPAADANYNVQIKIDNSASPKKIQYIVDTTILGNGWYDNPKQDLSSVTAVAFAGTGNITSFAGVNTVNGGTIVSKTEGAGFDFTNGVVTVNASSYFTNATVILTYKTEGAAEATVVEKTISASPLAFDLYKLTKGQITDYTIEIKSNDGTTTYATAHGNFASANPNDWFSAAVSAGAKSVSGADWETTPTISEGKYVIDGDSVLNVDDAVTNKCANKVSYVDTSLKYTTLIDKDSLTVVEDAIGGFSAVSDDNGKWVAMTGIEWVDLTATFAPQTNVDYVIRAEMDFASNPKRVRYSVSKDGDGFIPLTNGGSEWINMIVGTKNALESVTIKGSGELTSINGKVADPSIAEANGVKYATLLEALAAGNAVTLLTNATIGPGDLTEGDFTITKNGFSLLPGAVGEDWEVTITDNGGTYTVKIEKAAAGAIYMIY